MNPFNITKFTYQNTATTAVMLIYMVVLLFIARPNYYMVNVLFYLFLNIFELVSKVHGMRIELLKWSEGNCRLSQEHVIEKRDNKKKKIQYLWNSAYTRKITENIIWNWKLLKWTQCILEENHIRKGIKQQI